MVYLFIIADQIPIVDMLLCVTDMMEMVFFMLTGDGLENLMTTIAFLLLIHKIKA